MNYVDVFVSHMLICCMNYSMLMVFWNFLLKKDEILLPPKYFKKTFTFLMIAIILSSLSKIFVGDFPSILARVCIIAIIPPIIYKDELEKREN